ncbi:MAG: type IX secretion system membrane protein PorP/SprF [Chitinophagales bacterium]|nr:type IX secretion system membrane protein PorP/SprF [Chitinophagales bacterium]
MKNLTNYIILLIFICCTFQLNSQNVQTTNDLYFDRGNINTAFIIEDKPPLNLSLTSSLGGGVQDTRRINFLAYGNYNKLEIGVGLKVNTAFYGLLNMNTIETLYAKDFSINEKHRFYTGINFGIHHVGINTKRLNEYVQMQDPLIAGNAFPQYRFTAGFGLGYEIKDMLQAGISIPSLIKNKNDFRPDFIANVLYKKQLHPDFLLEPELLVYGARSNFTLEANASITYYDIFAFKLGIRTSKTLLFGFIWKRDVLSVGYIYSPSFGKYHDLNPGIHNINVFHEF